MTTTRTHTALTHTASVRIAGSHPSLAGHFPGRPVVPAVVLLNCVLDEAQRWLGAAPVATGLTKAKFTAPLLPEQTVQLELTLQGSELRFGLTRDAVSVARGTFRLAKRSESHAFRKRSGEKRLGDFSPLKKRSESHAFRKRLAKSASATFRP